MACAPQHRDESGGPPVWPVGPEHDDGGSAHGARGRSSADPTKCWRLAAAGSTDAVRRLLEGLRDDIYLLALRMLGHPADAEDAAQEILVVVLTNLGSFRAESW
jgi:Sigma-70 region 2